MSSGTAYVLTCPWDLLIGLLQIRQARGLALDTCCAVLRNDPAQYCRLDNQCSLEPLFDLRTPHPNPLAATSTLHPRRDTSATTAIPGATSLKQQPRISLQSPLSNNHAQSLTLIRRICDLITCLSGAITGGLSTVNFRGHGSYE